MLKFTKNINNSIRKHTLISGEKKLLASISGGQDSTCLIIILYLLQTQIQFTFGLIWLNHFWQKSSFFLMLHVSKYGYSLSLHTVLHLPLTQIVSEEKARNWRRSAIQRTHAFYAYDLSVQGHSKSDRVETILFNLIRGTGMSGISTLHRILNQIYLSNNKFYPIFFQLLKQTHLDITYDRLSLKQPNKNDFSPVKPKFTQFKLHKSNTQTIQKRSTNSQLPKSCSPPMMIRKHRRCYTYGDHAITVGARKRVCALRVSVGQVVHNFFYYQLKKVTLIRKRIN